MVKNVRIYTDNHIHMVCLKGYMETICGLYYNDNDELIDAEATCPECKRIYEERRARSERAEQARTDAEIEDELTAEANHLNDDLGSSLSDDIKRERVEQFMQHLKHRCSLLSDAPRERIIYDKIIRHIRTRAEPYMQPREEESHELVCDECQAAMKVRDTISLQRGPIRMGASIPTTHIVLYQCPECKNANIVKK